MGFATQFKVLQRTLREVVLTRDFLLVPLPFLGLPLQDLLLINAQVLLSFISITLELF